MGKKRLKGKGIIMVALFVISLAAFSGSMPAKGRKGTDIAVMKTDGNPKSGELIAVKQQALLIKEKGTQADVSISIGDVKYIKIVGKSYTGLGALLGLAGGGALGILLMSKGHTVPSSWYVQSAAGFGGAGALVGALIGAGASKKSSEIQVEGKNDDEIKAILKDLRSMARIPDAQ